ncbi:MAG TPA: TetR/AcrR family transcriptional regulator [Acidimicrobiales bacterium]|nr:TetR/AcrR family transcriptional regulator [Acidimicrobiales bacterium]
MPKIVDIEQRRAEIADAAARLIARSGLDAVTMREVAAEAGWTTGAVTHYFADKRELLLKTFQASLAHRRSLRTDRADATPLEQLWASLEGALPLDADRRRHWMVTVACCSQAVADDSIADAQRDAYREFAGYVAELCVAAGLASESEAESRAGQLIAVADGIAIQALFDDRKWPPARQRRVFEDMLTSHGVRRPNVPPPGDR